MKIQEARAVLIQLDTLEQMENLEASLPCYTRPDIVDDLILDICMIECSEPLQASFAQATGVQFSTVEDYDYIICWR